MEGKTWDYQAAMGSWGTSNNAVLVDHILELFGNIMSVPDYVGVTSVVGMVVWMYFLHICKK